MAGSLVDWRFADTVTGDRRPALERGRSFEDIAAEIRAEARIVSFRGENGKQGLVKNCLRPEFKLEISPHAFDEFFNGRSGYRAAYYIDPEQGHEANRSFLNSILETLVAYALSHPAGQPLNEDTVRRSLTLPSAKVWLDEEVFCFDHKLAIDILVPEWSAAARDALAAFGRHTRPDPPEKEKAIWGVRAPIGSRLDIKGAFVAANGTERIAEDKRERSSELHNYGFA